MNTTRVLGIVAALSVAGCGGKHDASKAKPTNKNTRRTAATTILGVDAGIVIATSAGALDAIAATGALFGSKNAASGNKLLNSLGRVANPLLPLVLRPAKSQATHFATLFGVEPPNTIVANSSQGVPDVYFATFPAPAADPGGAHLAKRLREQLGLAPTTERCGSGCTMFRGAGKSKVVVAMQSLPGFTLAVALRHWWPAKNKAVDLQVVRWALQPRSRSANTTAEKRFVAGGSPFAWLVRFELLRLERFGPRNVASRITDISNKWRNGVLRELFSVTESAWHLHTPKHAEASDSVISLGPPSNPSLTIASTLTAHGRELRTHDGRALELPKWTGPPAPVVDVALTGSLHLLANAPVPAVWKLPARRLMTTLLECGLICRFSPLQRSFGFAAQSQQTLHDQLAALPATRGMRLVLTGTDKAKPTGGVAIVARTAAEAATIETTLRARVSALPKLGVKVTVSRLTGARQPTVVIGLGTDASTAFAADTATTNTHWGWRASADAGALPGLLGGRAKPNGATLRLRSQRKGDAQVVAIAGSPAAVTKAFSGAWPTSSGPASKPPAADPCVQQLSATLDQVRRAMSKRPSAWRKTAIRAARLAGPCPGRTPRLAERSRQLSSRLQLAAGLARLEQRKPTEALASLRRACQLGSPVGCAWPAAVVKAMVPLAKLPSIGFRMPYQTEKARLVVAGDGIWLNKLRVCTNAQATGKLDCLRSALTALDRKLGGPKQRAEEAKQGFGESLGAITIELPGATPWSRAQLLADMVMGIGSFRVQFLANVRGKVGKVRVDVAKHRSGCLRLRVGANVLVDEQAGRRLRAPSTRDLIVPVYKWTARRSGDDDDDDASGCSAVYFKAEPTLTLSHMLPLMAAISYKRGGDTSTLKGFLESSVSESGLPDTRSTPTIH